MVKPVFKTLGEIQKAPTAEMAQGIAAEFFSSAAARTVNRSQAGTFLKQVEKVFIGHKAPQHYEAFLRSANSLNSEASCDLQQLASFALIDFNAVKKGAEEIRSHAQDISETLATVKRHEADGFLSSTQVSMPAESPLPEYPEFLIAQTAAELQLAINQVMLERDISDEQVPIFFDAITKAFEELNIPIEKQIDLLAFVQDGTAVDSALYDLAVNRASKLIQDSQGPVPKSAHYGGSEFGPT